MMNNFLNWSINHPDEWEAFMCCLDGTFSEDIEELFQVLNRLYKNPDKHSKDLAYFILEPLKRTRIGGNCLDYVMAEAFEELWGENAQDEFLNRYLQKLQEVLENTTEDDTNNTIEITNHKNIYPLK